MTAGLPRRAEYHRALSAVEAGSVVTAGPVQGVLGVLERAGLITLPGRGAVAEVTELGQHVLAEWDWQWPPEHWLDWVLVERYLLPRERRLELAAQRGTPDRRLSDLERCVVARTLWDRGASPEVAARRAGSNSRNLRALLEGWPGTRPLPAREAA